MFDGENISFDASLVIYINSTNISPGPEIDPRWCHLGFFPWFLPTKPCALRSTQPLKMSTRDFSWGKGGRGLNLPGTPRATSACRGIPLIYFTNIPPIMIINRIYEHQKLLSL